MSWSVWGRQCEGRGLRRGQTTPGCCTMTKHLLTLHSLSVNFCKQPLQSPDFAPAVSCLLFYTAKPSWKDPDSFNRNVNGQLKMSWSAWGRQCEGRGLRRGQTTPGCSTMAMHLLTLHSLSVNFLWSMRWLLSPSRPTLQIWPLQTFSCSRS